jgi:hypothetical protein
MQYTTPSDAVFIRIQFGAARNGLQTNTVVLTIVVGRVFFGEHIANGPGGGHLQTLEMHGTALAWPRLFRLVSKLQRLPTATFTSGPFPPKLSDNRAPPSPRVPLCRVCLSLNRTLSSLRIWTGAEAPRGDNSELELWSQQHRREFR